MSDARDFLLNTDYEMDKIVYYKSGELLPNNGHSAQTIDNFNLGFIPLIFAVFSFDKDFTDTRMDFMYSINNDVTIIVNAYSDSVRIDYWNTPNPNKKLYYRVYGFEPSNSRASVGYTQKDAKEFILNTDYNYCKLYKKGVVDSDTTITHNLGYVPFVLAWEEDKWTNPAPGVITPCWLSGGESPGTSWSVPSISVTDKTVKIDGIPTNGKVHYRIYYDEV